MDQRLAANGHGPSGRGPAPPAEAARPCRHDLDRMAGRMNDVVVRRIFSAGLDLQAALGLLREHEPGSGHGPGSGPGSGHGPASDHPAASKISHATDELDRAIRDLRDILFEPW